MAAKQFIGAKHVREANLTMGVEVLKTDKTLFVAPMNDQAGEDPQPIQCKTMSEVFSTFRPSAEISVEAEDGSTSDATIRFDRVSDFLPSAVTAQAQTLSAIQTEIAVLKDLLVQLRKPTLRRTVDNPKEREVLLNGVRLGLKALGVKEG